MATIFSVYKAFISLTGERRCPTDRGLQWWWLRTLFIEIVRERLSWRASTGWVLYCVSAGQDGDFFVSLYLMPDSHIEFHVDGQLEGSPRFHILLELFFLYFRIEKIGDEDISDQNFFFIFENTTFRSFFRVFVEMLNCFSPEISCDEKDVFIERYISHSN